MGKIFVDTSALFPLVSTKDATSRVSVNVWEDIAQSENELFTNNYVIVECLSLVQRRLGLEFVHHLRSEILPLIAVDWIDEEQHAMAVQYVLKSNRRNLSLVDCSVFQTMRRQGIDTVFTFDNHFREEGFTVIP
jgi:predicted nucleic acid-binding protein